MSASVSSRVSDIVAIGPDDDPTMSVMIDAALAHLIQSEENIHEIRGEINPTAIQHFNTSVVRLRYRTRVEIR